MTSDKRQGSAWKRTMSAYPCDYDKERERKNEDLNNYIKEEK